MDVQGKRVIIACAGPSEYHLAMANTVDGDADGTSVLQLLQGSYKEVLDAVKHQDDKIGRLFAGVSFLTAASLAMANLGGSRYLSQTYVDGPDVPLAMLTLTSFLVVIVTSVMLLVGSLATPLRVPGLARGPRSRNVDWVGTEASQIYFSEISRVSTKEWEAKWKAPIASLERELVQTLVGETHNLAVRTQFKYGRMNEAISLLNLGLLFLSMTMVLCAISAGVGTSAFPLAMPLEGKWALAGTVGMFIFLQLLAQVRYSRQTMDELDGRDNERGGALRYVWVFSATTWSVLVASGELVDGIPHRVVVGVASVGVVSLVLGTHMQRSAKKVKPFEKLRDWTGAAFALLCALVLTWLSGVRDEIGGDYVDSLAISVLGATLLTLFSALSPTFLIRRNLRKFRERKRSRNGQPEEPSPVDP